MYRNYYGLFRGNRRNHRAKPSMMPDDSRSKKNNEKIVFENNPNNQEMTQAYEKYETQHPERGALMVQTMTDRRSTTVPDALVHIIKEMPNEQNYEIICVKTDAAGMTEAIELPATASCIAKDITRISEYECYTVVAEHIGFVTTVCRNVPVFEGVTTREIVDMKMHYPTYHPNQS